MAAPGVVVTTAVRSGPAGTPRAQSGQLFVLGIAERGPTVEPAKLNSMADYQRLFGARVPFGTLYDSLSMYFETGGGVAHVLRAVGPAATVGELEVTDRAATPVPTIEVTAADPGAWSSRLTVSFLPGTNPDSVLASVLLDGAVVESYDNLASIGDIVTRFSRSPYIRVADLGSATEAPDNLPATTVAEALSAGTDDRAAVNTSILTETLTRFKVGLGDGAVAAPGYGETMHGPLLEHARSHRRVAILAETFGSTVEDLVETSLGLAATSGAEYGGLFAPWLLVSDGAGGTRPVSPEGFVAAARSKAHETAGPWRPAAGELSISPYIVGLEREFTRAEHEVLDAARVNPIRLISNSIRLYGWRSLSGDEAFTMLTVGDMLNRIVTEAEVRLEPFVFREIDGRGQVLPQIEGVLIGMLQPMADAGGLYERIVDGEVIDPGYTVGVGANINTLESLQRNEINAEIAGRFSPAAALIRLTVTKVGLMAGV